jgi:hypothetical protein
MVHKATADAIQSMDSMVATIPSMQESEMLVVVGMIFI